MTLCDCLVPYYTTQTDLWVLSISIILYICPGIKVQRKPIWSTAAGYGELWIQGQEIFLLSVVTLLYRNQR